MEGNPSLDTHDGGSTASWLWSSCQPIVGSIQYAIEGILLLIISFFMMLIYLCYLIYLLYEVQKKDMKVNPNRASN